MQENGLLLVPALTEVVTRDELLHSEIGGHINQVFEIQLSKPDSIVKYLSLFLIQYAESLLGVGFAIGLHLLRGQDRAQFIFVRRVADQRSVIADQENDLMAQILELAQLAHTDGVSQMQVS